MPVPTNTTDSKAPTTQSLFAGFLRSWLGLTVEQVVVYNQKWKIPNDERMYLTISSVGPQRPYSATTEYVSAGTLERPALVEEIAIGSREMIGIDLYSRSQEAVDRKEEITMALASTALQQLCEQYALKVARIPMTFVDLSGLEGVARLNRFHLAFAVLRTRTTSKAVEFFDRFQKPSLVIEP